MVTQAGGAGAVPVPDAAGRLSLVLPAGAAGQWCRLSVRTAAAGRWWTKVEATDLIRGQVMREAFLGRLRRGRRALLLHVPAGASHLVLVMIAEDGGPVPGAVPSLRVLGRWSAAARLLLAGWRKLPRCLTGDPTGLVGRLRVELGQAPARAGEAPPYEVWVRLYDSWGAAERMALAASTGAPIEVVVVGAPAPASEASVAVQWVAAARCSTVASLDGFSRLPGVWLLVLQAGDVLAAHATACFAHAIARQPGVIAMYADVDCLADGLRTAPLFKPCADPWLLRSGLLTQGACVLHPDVATDTTQGAFGRVPFILTHVHCIRPALPAIGPDAGAMRAGAGNRPKVSIVIASGCRAPHVLRCLRGLLRITDYADLEVLLAVARIDQDDVVQRRVLRQAGALGRVRVLDLKMTVFNYAAVNNAAAQSATGELLLLLNDDVMPVRGDWLQRMVAFTQHQAGPGDAAQAADLVGARLLYGNTRVQHGGVIMGLAHLCEHAFRLTARDDGGPHGIALADRQVSAVTAACLLVRRSRWLALGGMDEGFAVALNDVDFCLRAGQAGARIAYAAAAELYHYEGTSLGRHYQGSRAALESFEVGRLRARWQSVIADDPFYNPQASSEPGREFQPAFPPRLTPLCWSGSENAAQG